MKKSNEKFLEFNGKAVSFRHVDGEWRVAIRPICEILGISYKHQHETIKKDEILGQLSGIYGMVAGDGKLREMFALPEKYIYGWMFSLRSDSPDLLKFKKECYDVLFDYFNGGFRSNKIAEQVKNNIEIQKLKKEIDDENINSAKHIKIENLKAANISLGKQIFQYDKEQKEGYTDLFTQEN